jgi:hypothetical protein
MVDGESKVLDSREHSKPDLVINKVPGNVADDFRTFADVEFDGHYGFCLKWLMEMKDLYIELERLINISASHENRLSRLESNDRSSGSVTPTRTIRMLDGSTRTVNAPNER